MTDAPIVVLRLRKWQDSNPERIEYARETTHFFVKASGKRDSKTSIYYQYFSTEEEALAECVDRRNRVSAKEEETRREIASVNALAGIPIEAIESGVVGEMVAALEKIVGATPLEMPDGPYDPLGGYCSDNIGDVINATQAEMDWHYANIARPILAKLKGNAA